MYGSEQYDQQRLLLVQVIALRQYQRHLASLHLAGEVVLPLVFRLGFSLLSRLKILLRVRAYF